MYQHQTDVFYTLQGLGACSCSDCEQSCVPPEFEPDREPFSVGAMDGVGFVMLLVGIVGTAIFLAVEIVPHVIKRERRGEGSDHQPFSVILCPWEFNRSYHQFMTRNQKRFDYN